MLVSVVISVLVLWGEARAESLVTCSSENLSCEAHADNTLATQGGVVSLQECRDLCLNTTGCRSFNIS